ncbi:MAG TPA: shikimate kinase [Flavobacterium sp.]|nr:shikimate kinase [Flavobacterium sp.]
MRKVIIIGYMGSGKSTIARLLSEKMQVKALDLDQIIENHTGVAIKNIFEAEGEIYFRKLESKIFREIMDSDESFILSLGGGTPCYANNHELLNAGGAVSFYLKCSIETLYQRLHLAKEGRPLIAAKDEGQLKEFIAKSLFDRSFYYNQASYAISADGRSADEIVADIWERLA